MRNDGENHKSKSEKNEGGNHRLESENEGENHESKSEKNEGENHESQSDKNEGENHKSKSEKNEGENHESKSEKNEGENHKSTSENVGENHKSKSENVGENHKSKSEKNEGENHESKSEKREGKNHKSKWKKNEGGNQLRRDPYEVLGVPRNSTDQEIKSTYRKLALKYHPDKNANDPKATDMFKEITFSYSLLSDPDKRHQYDTKGFEVGFRRIKAVEESQDFELDLANLGAVNTVFAAIFSKLGVPIKTSISATVLEEALNGSVSIRPLVLGQPVVSKVEKQCAHFYSVTITVKEAQGGLVCRVQSTDKSKFKLLYFEQEVNGGLSLAMQEGSRKTGKVTSAGMYFLGFPVYRFDQPSNSMTYPKDSDNAFFRKLDGFQPCEINELKAGKHTFAVYGDNFFKNVSYTIEVICAASLGEQKEDLRAIEAQILSKRVTLSKFETEYKQAIAQFKEVTSRYSQEKQVIDNLLKQRNEIRTCYTIASPRRCSNNSSRKMDAKDDGHHVRDEKDRSNKKGWFNIHVKLGKRKP